MRDRLLARHALTGSDTSEAPTVLDLTSPTVTEPVTPTPDDGVLDGRSDQRN